MFGLHANADITFQDKEANSILDTIISIQPRTAAGGDGKGPDEQVMEVAVDIESKIPQPLSASNVHPSVFARGDDGAVNSLGTFLAIEMAKFNKLLGRVRSTLSDLQRAIKGLVVMSADLERMYTDFLFNKVPGLWMAVSYPNLMPLASYVADFVARFKFMDGWLTGGTPPVFWISAFFFPQGFMTAALQSHARKTQIPIDTLCFHTVMTDTREDAVSSAPADGVYVYGLFMEGARWDGEAHSVNESTPGVLYDRLPCIHLNPVTLTQMKEVERGSSLYMCPMYKTSTRAGTLSTTGHSTNFVTYVQLPTVSMSPDHWIRRGVALLCMLND